MLDELTWSLKNEIKSKLLKSAFAEDKKLYLKKVHVEYNPYINLKGY